jgi:hypothetical protein
MHFTNVQRLVLDKFFDRWGSKNNKQSVLMNINTAGKETTSVVIQSVINYYDHDKSI